MKRILTLSLTLLIGCYGAVAAHADSRFLVTQSTPSDCGPAALATLLHYYFGVPTSEAEIVKLSKARPDIGTSLLSLEEAAVQKECAADSFRMTYKTLQEQLATYPTPVIVRTLNPEPHFVVLFATDKDYVYMADPAAGNIVMRTDEFLQRWHAPGFKEGYVLVVAGPETPLTEERRQLTLAGIKQGMRNLQTIRPPVAMFRR